MKVVAYDKYKKNYSNQYTQEVTHDELLSEADIISLHIPLSLETQNMVDDDYIRSCKKNIIIINTSRGQIVNTKDLAKNLKTGKVIGAALDVLEKEDFSNYSKEDLEWFDYLSHSEKIVLTSHIAGWTKESQIRNAEILKDKIIKFFENQ